MSTPDEELACRVAERLVTAGIASPGGRDALARQLAAGGMKAEDWQALLDGTAATDAPQAAAPDELPF